MRRQVAFEMPHIDRIKAHQRVVNRRQSASVCGLPTRIRLIGEPLLEQSRVGDRGWIASS